MTTHPPMRTSPSMICSLEMQKFYAKYPYAKNPCPMNGYEQNQERLNLPFKASKMMKMNALLGALLATVIPHPLYSPFKPYCLQIATPSSQNLTCGAVLDTETVCIRDLIVSAGKKRKLYDIPAEAPATACCQSGRGARPVSDVVGRF